ncbi:hypothetical protein [Morganella morganii]|uniref:hypothetical protein n=1 Tax=Morganella morganii TaxID=582 RepID=UPI0018989E5B|nr:hypothetical protein [Morganella morganii]
MFGFRITDEFNKGLFVPSAQCYVFYKSYPIIKGTTANKLKTGIPGAIPCVVFSKETKLNQDSSFGGLNIGYAIALVENGEWVINSSGFTGVYYFFMPSSDAERIAGDKPSWGARFYDENGRASFVGWQKPLTVDGFVQSKINEAFNGTRLSKSNLAIPCGGIGQARIYMGGTSGVSGFTVFNLTLSMYQDRISYKFLPVGEAPGGSGTIINTGSVPLIDTSIYS